MKCVLRFSPELEDDVVAGYEWYENKARGLGEEFLRMFDSALSLVLRYPLLSPEIDKGFRRRLLRRFPYAIYYIIEGNEIIVYGFFHCARDPANIKEKLFDRSEE